MKPIVPVFALFLLLVSCSYENHDGGIKKQPDMTVMLYPDGAPDTNGLEEGSEGLQTGYTQIGNVPRMSFFFPKKPNGQMVMITPGGGYKGVYTFGGVIAANWLGDRGISTCLLEYRMPAGNMEIPLEDVQNALRYCRRNASSWGISRIGLLGGSAGGHLSSLASNRFTDAETRPDFTVLLYPLISLVDSNDQTILEQMFGPDCSSEDRARYSTERLVSEDTPPTFIACNKDDLIVPYHNSEMYRDSLISHGVPVEFHLYETGFHGWAFNSKEYCDILNEDSKGYYGLSDTADVHYEDMMEKWRKSFEEDLTCWLKNLIFAD